MKTNLFPKNKKEFMLLLPLVIGVAASLLVFYFFFSRSLNNAYLCSFLSLLIALYYTLSKHKKTVIFIISINYLCYIGIMFIELSMDRIIKDFSFRSLIIHIFILIISVLIISLKTFFEEEIIISKTNDGDIK